MTCGIYAIVNKINDKRYIGKSINIEKRWKDHLYLLRKKMKSKDCNRYLYYAFNKYGETSFGFEYLEVFDKIDDALLKSRELYWIEKLNTTNRCCGYNLRKDSDTGCIVSDETRLLISKQVSGENNPNYGNNWTPYQKQKASVVAKQLHITGVYSGEETLKKHSESSIEFWKNNPEKKEQMKNKVSLARTTFKIGQYDRNENLIKIWDTMFLLLKSNPDFHRISIYNCLNGYKKTYKNFVWKKLFKI